MYLCTTCGNKTRFDLFESRRMRTFQHYSLGGEMNVEEEEIAGPHHREGGLPLVRGTS